MSVLCNMWDADQNQIVHSCVCLGQSNMLCNWALRTDVVFTAFVLTRSHICKKMKTNGPMYDNNHKHRNKCQQKKCDYIMNSNGNAVKRG